MCTKVDQEALGTNSHSKRKALDMLSNIFRKKARDVNGKENQDESLIKNDGSTEPMSGLSPGYNFPPNSPVSPRVKNIKEDMEALLISRQDNPYISHKLEQLSSCGDYSNSNMTLNCSMHISINVEQENSQSLLSMEYQDGDELSFTQAMLDEPGLNLHEHLIRSPPPQFPQKVSHFVFPDSVGSPLRGVMSHKGKMPLSPSRGNVLRSPQPDHSLLNLAVPSTPPAMQQQLQQNISKGGNLSHHGSHNGSAASGPGQLGGRRCSHPMDEDISPTLALPPLLPAQRAHSGPVTCSSILGLTRPQATGSMAMSTSKEALLANIST